MRLAGRVAIVTGAGQGIGEGYAKAVAREGALLRIEPTGHLAPVLAAIEATGATIARIESRQANLETAFLALTGRALRDAA